MGKRILVIGSSGLLGAPVAIHLKRNGFIVRLLVSNVDRAAKRFGSVFEIVEGDLKNLASLENAMDSCFGVHINLSG